MIIFLLPLLLLLSKLFFPPLPQKSTIRMLLSLAVVGKSAEITHLDIFLHKVAKISHQLFALLFLSANQECHKCRNIFKLYQV